MSISLCIPSLYTLCSIAAAEGNAFNDQPSKHSIYHADAKRGKTIKHYENSAHHSFLIITIKTFRSFLGLNGKIDLEHLLGEMATRHTVSLARYCLLTNHSPPHKGALDRAAKRGLSDLFFTMIAKGVTPDTRTTALSYLGTSNEHQNIRIFLLNRKLAPEQETSQQVKEEEIQRRREAGRPALSELPTLHGASSEHQNIRTFFFKYAFGSSPR
jgi:hypothetical protein